MERIEVRITGKVQMVMFRDFTQRKAKRLKLVGEVMNLNDGSVLVIAEGEKRHLKKLIAKLHKGPLLARVDEVQVAWLPATGEFDRFSLILKNGARV